MANSSRSTGYFATALCALALGAGALSMRSTQDSARLDPVGIQSTHARQPQVPLPQAPQRKPQPQRALPVSQKGLEDRVRAEDTRSPHGAVCIDRKYELGASAAPARESTQYIILHTTEGTDSARKIRKDRSANYLISADGVIYSIVPEQSKANHAGVSQWDEIHYLNGHSIGIEVEGTYQKPLTAKQYGALRTLVRTLQEKHSIPDNNVLSHSQVAYGCNKHTLGLKQRGRKLCASTLDWELLGIEHNTDDRDVAQGYILAQDARLFSDGRVILPNGSVSNAQAEARNQGRYQPRQPVAPSASSQANVLEPRSSAISNCIKEYRLQKGQTPAKLVGQAYDDATTWYYTQRRWRSAKEVNFRKLQIGDVIVTGMAQRPTYLPAK